MRTSYEREPRSQFPLYPPWMFVLLLSLALLPSLILDALPPAALRRVAARVAARLPALRPHLTLSLPSHELHPF